VSFAVQAHYVNRSVFSACGLNVVGSERTRPVSARVSAENPPGWTERSAQGSAAVRSFRYCGGQGPTLPVPNLVGGRTGGPAPHPLRALAGRVFFAHLTPNFRWATATIFSVTPK
jgi:hypothetical protein